MNRTLTALLLSTLSALTLSQQALANRPATDEQSSNADESAGMHSEHMNAGTQHSESRPESMPADTMQEEAEGPSAVESMMQRQNGYQSGDVIQLQATEIQPGETIRIKLLDYPRRGMSMEKVQQEYGQPIAISETVGKPPITNWTYNDRIVYFEYSTVLHVVAR